MGCDEPYKLTEETVEKILGYVRKGIAVDVAARASGITNKTFYVWCDRARKRENEYRNFFNRVQQAMAESETDMVEQLDKAAAEKIWQVTAWKLERKFPQRWGKQERAAIKQGLSEGFEQALDYLATKLDKDVYEQVIRALSDFQFSSSETASTEPAADGDSEH